MKDKSTGNPMINIVVHCGRCGRQLKKYDDVCMCKRRPPRGPRYEGPMRA
ncbi:hypothetical protein PBI_GRAY_7 [Gordonia phage Gray]|nr:hypothetical protein PBI_GRAY_7 [Gordonia phage Gray]